jgi:hypothetical protein
MKNIKFYSFCYARIKLAQIPSLFIRAPADALLRSLHTYQHRTKVVDADERKIVADALPLNFYNVNSIEE